MQSSQFVNTITYVITTSNYGKVGQLLIRRNRLCCGCVAIIQLTITVFENTMSSLHKLWLKRVIIIRIFFPRSGWLSKGYHEKSGSFKEATFKIVTVYFGVGLMVGTNLPFKKHNYKSLQRSIVLPRATCHNLPAVTGPPCEAKLVYDAQFAVVSFTIFDKRENKINIEMFMATWLQ